MPLETWPDEDYTNLQAIEKDLIFLGLVGIIDPPRPEVKHAISICQQAGIQVKMITGDQALTEAIGKVEHRRRRFTVLEWERNI